MIRTALIIGAAIIVSTCVSCAVGTGPAPPPPGGGPAPFIRAACSAADFRAKIAYYEDSQYHPGPGVRPPATTTFPTNHHYVDDLVKVFTDNPQFQPQLCKLDAVYVNGSTCTSYEECFDGSWGWRQRVPTIGSGRAVALSADVWNKPSYSQYETDLMQTVLPVGAYYSGAQSCSGEICTSIDSFETALTSALAHEVGHVLWYDLVSIYDPGSGTYSDPNLFCSGTFFQHSWRTPIKPPPYWRDVLTPQQRQSNGWPNMHKVGPHIRDIDRSGNAQYRANQTFALLGAAQPWVSAFAAMSPDEDFVETYRFITLATAPVPLNSAEITVPTLPPSYPNIAADYARGGKGILKKKIDCIQQALNGYR